MGDFISNSFVEKNQLELNALDNQQKVKAIDGTLQDIARVVS